MLYANENDEFIHAPSAVLDYGFYWEDWLEVGETISTSTWVVDSPLTKSSEQNSNNITSLFVTGGVVSKSYKLVNTITTSAGRTDARTIKLSCQLR